MTISNIIKKITPASFLRYYHFFLALAGAVIYGFPARKITVIAVTGTKGKSSSIALISQILEAAGQRVAFISSIKFKLAEKEWPNKLKMTMPGRLAIQAFIRKAVNKDCDYFLLEATSEGIIQYRHKFLNCDIVAFTNLEPEHIERHGSFEKYRQAKMKLFQENKNTHIVNLDDKESRHFLAIRAQEKIGFSLLTEASAHRQPVGHDKSALKEIIRAAAYQETPQGIYLKIKGKDFNLKLRGRFNAYNVLLALTVALNQGISLDIAKSALEKVETIAGRLETVITEPFRAIVDYAHTPGSLEQVYQTLKENYPGSNLVCLLGACGGGRDKWKRPIMGSIAARYCQRIILTNEDPYDEDPLEIINGLKEGIAKANYPQEQLKIILDRRQAIRTALALARDNDTIIATGKGAEPWICLKGGKKIAWQEKEIFLEEWRHNNA